MRSLIVLLGLIATPAFAAPPILGTDLLSDDERMLTFSYDRSNAAAGGIYPDGTPFDVSSNITNEITLGLAYGISDRQMVSLDVPYLLSSRFRVDYEESGSAVTGIAEQEGLGDVSVNYSLLLFESERTRMIAGLSAMLPTGDDDAGQMQEKTDGVEDKPLKKGGAGSGLTDYSGGLAISRESGSFTYFLSGEYTLAGSKTEDGQKYEPGNDWVAEVGFKHQINDESAAVVVLGYLVNEEGKDGTEDLSGYSTTGLTFALFYMRHPQVLFSPQIFYGKSEKSKRTDRQTGDVTRIDEFDVINFRLQYKRIF